MCPTTHRGGQDGAMCFSPQGDVAGGAVVMAIGLDACLHLEGRREYRALAVVPLVLGAHQVDEAFVWWSLQGHVPRSVGQVAMWIYLVFALVVLPVAVPLLVLSIERVRRRRWGIVPFVALGAVVSSILGDALVVHGPSARIGAYHIAYSVGLRDGVVVVALYVVATCGSMLASSSRDVIWFGAANAVAVVILARLCADGFTSLWCFYAALVSGAIALRLRLTSGRRTPRPAREVAGLPGAAST
jgi:hypothetical protein